MHKRNTKSTGFTIVELLIVIVVIAILAAISIVAYSGIQERARNAQRVAAAREWQKIIVAYTSSNGRYPDQQLNNHVCLGGEGYPTDFDTNPNIDCNGTGNIKHPNATVSDAYATIASPPRYPGEKTDTGTFIGVTAGISVRALDTLDPSGAAKTLYPMLHYWLYGTSKDCVLRPVAQQVAGGWQQSSGGFTQNQGGFTYCVILLPDPSNL